MKKKILREVIACLPKERVLFRYTKDDYAFWLLAQMAGSYGSLQELKKSPFGKLLEKPSVNEWMGQVSSSRWFGPDFGIGREGALVYRLEVDAWGDDDSDWRFDQVSRRGQSLVLQLNLNGKEHLGLRRLIGRAGEDPFGYRSHPVRLGRHATLAWARIDWDFTTGEALIEEVQTDRLRFVRKLLERKPCEQCQLLHYGHWRFERKAVERYWMDELAAHDSVWAEATLLAGIRFLVEEIGIKKLFYHTFETGCRLKGIDEQRPPKSLYTKLPKKFCFEETSQIPEFLKPRKSRRSRKHFEKRLGCDPRFFLLEM